MERYPTETYQDIQEMAREHCDSERSERGGSYLAALYNLDLPEVTSQELSEQRRRELAHVVWLFQEPRRALGQQSPTFGGTPPKSGTVYEDGFMLDEWAMGYKQPDSDGIMRPGNSWWNSDDFEAFCESYSHLCRCVEQLTEGHEHYGRSHLDEAEWLNEKTKLFQYEVFVSGPELESISSIRNVMNEQAALDHQHRGPEWVPITIKPIFSTEIEPSDRILYEAYTELIGIFSQELMADSSVFRRCASEDCGKVFRKAHGNTKYHSEACRIRAQNADRDQQRIKHREQKYDDVADLLAVWAAQHWDEWLTAKEITQSLRENPQSLSKPDAEQIVHDHLSGYLDGRQIGAMLSRLEERLQRRNVAFERRKRGPSYQYSFRRIEL